VMDAAAMQSAFREVIAQARILNIE